ncbi:MAG: nucleoside 2-deoxyribosyltransferase [Candidatus Shapirobacteria bacterium]
MKIYFGGSITGGRDDKDFYAKIIKLLKNYGNVLTEHIGDKDLSIMGENHQSAKFVYDRDMEWLRESDVVVAEVSTPSLGVGFEIAKANEWGKKIICLYRPQESKKLSAIISGCDGVKVFEYKEISDLKSIFDLNLK